MTKKIFQKFAFGALIVVMLSALGLTAEAQSKKDQKRSKQLVEQADKDFRAKNYKAALDKYTEAVLLVPNKNPNAHFWKGYSHSYLKEDDLALAEFDIALTQGYKPLDIYKVRLSLLLDKKDYDGALADLKPLLESEPENEYYLTALAEISYGKEDYQTALDAYKRVVLKNPGRGNLYYYIAQVQSKLGNADAQGDAAEEAIRKNTQFLGDSYMLLADARQKQKQFPAAIDAYERALSSKPDIYLAYRQLAELYRSESRISDAIEISKKALRQFPNDGNIYTDLGWFYSVSDRHEEAVQAAQAGVKLLPDQYMAYTNLCRAYNDVRKPEMAISACNNALRLDPNDGETYFYLGRANDLLSKRDEAAKNYKRAITGLIVFTESNPDYSDGYYLLGNAYLSDGQNLKAFEAYARCLELNPRFVKARFNAGLTQVNLRNKAAAIEQYDFLLKLDADLAGKLKAGIDRL